MVVSQVDSDRVVRREAKVEMRLANLYLWLLFLLLLVPLKPSLAASVYVTNSSSGALQTVVISGEIVPGDTEKFLKVIGSTKHALIILSSPGGSVIESLQIGRLIRSKGFVTAVPNDTLCVSACALIWLAGSPRYGEDRATIGFHAAYVYRNGQQQEIGVGNALIGAYMNELGFSDRAVTFVTSAPPQGIELLTPAKGQANGIVYTSIRNALRQAHAQKQELNFDRTDVGIREEPYDPLRAVQRFYAALTRADGSAAAALVVPDKRGKGPFNETNIGSFFGNMREPLRVLSIQQVEPNLVRVNYTYRVTKTPCNGVAFVETTYVAGNTLISRIRANC